mmetsp:Transcript_53885/g.65047  ORF Transcript_53885/g.65047 Transcript_53885/m.65047 type:complete len:188 (-) Transcript_53885:229-792(-)|eukprot:CAMPEP_0172511268 /NCGR_PEP_ID=MMETSP1066-20121228/235130_1 /TAXON_ID=671091 /ORGANISM="Coscinodiscus wailesii, Strain CCMP2513" /LENGTH=187 /DNA_ID=CAMNT_0013290577 /DNA_START=130 /DNA_END=693 /DNA_ORIENTATION=+
MNDTVDVTVLRTSDALRSTIKLPLSAPLNTLKDQISLSPLGPLSREHQRIFHLGRELKSGKRSLHSLGFGRHGIFVIHLHSTQPETIHLKDDDDDVEVAGVKINNASMTTSGSSAGNCDEIEVIGSRRLGQPPPPRHMPYRQHQQQPVIDLLDSDDDGDDDDDVVQVVEGSSGSSYEDYTYKRRRFR